MKINIEFDVQGTDFDNDGFVEAWRRSKVAHKVIELIEQGCVCSIDNFKVSQGRTTARFAVWRMHGYWYVADMALATTACYNARSSVVALLEFRNARKRVIEGLVEYWS